MKAKNFAVLKWSIIAILTSFVSSTVCTILLGRAASSICVLIGFIINQLDNFGNDVYSMDKSAINNIQDIIHKAKDSHLYDL